MSCSTAAKAEAADRRLSAARVQTRRRNPKECRLPTDSCHFYFVETNRQSRITSSPWAIRSGFFKELFWDFQRQLKENKPLQFDRFVCRKPEWDLSGLRYQLLTIWSKQKLWARSRKILCWPRGYILHENTFSTYHFTTWFHKLWQLSFLKKKTEHRFVH